MVAVNKHKLYFHINPKTGVVFYVGIGIRSRHLDTQGRSAYWKRYVNKYGLKVLIVASGLSHEEAIRREKYWISKLGRKILGLGHLINLTDGGEGCVGSIKTPEIRQRMSIAAKSRKKYLLTEEHKANISKSLTGKTHTDERRKKNSEQRKILHATNPNMGMSGKVCSEETKRKIGEANAVIRKGRKSSEETKLKLSIYRTGRKLSEETKKRIGQSNKKAWELKVA